jgi:hypothetical protein
VELWQFCCFCLIAEADNGSLCIHLTMQEMLSHRFDDFNQNRSVFSPIRKIFVADSSALTSWKSMSGARHV